MTTYLTIQEHVPNATKIAEAAWTNYLNLPEFNNFNTTKRILMAFEINYQTWKQTPFQNIAIWNSILNTIQLEAPAIYGTTLRVLYETMEKSKYNLDTFRTMVYSETRQISLDILTYSMPTEIKTLVGETTYQLIQDMIGDNSSDRGLLILNNTNKKLIHLQTIEDLSMLFKHAYQNSNIERVLQIPDVYEYYAYEILCYKNNYIEYINLFNTKREQLNFFVSTVEILTTYSKERDDMPSTEVLKAVMDTNNAIYKIFETMYPQQYQLYKTLKAIDAYDYNQLTTIIQEYNTDPIENYPLPLM